MSASTPIPARPLADAEVWFVPLAAATAALETAEHTTPRLSDVERRRHARYTSGDPDGRLWRASHIALRLLIERWAGPGSRGQPFVVSHGGRPELPDSAVSFSLSHSSGAALIGLTWTGPIGVDIEGPRTVTMTGDRRRKLEDRAESLAGRLPQVDHADQRFLQGWTRLEAHAKAHGHGVLRMLADAGLRRGGPPIADGRFAVIDIELPDGCCGAAAMPAPASAPAIFTLPATIPALAELLSGEPGERR